jgi:hypothetical protein
MSAILAVPVPIEVMAMAGTGTYSSRPPPGARTAFRPVEPGP